MAPNIPLVRPVEEILAPPVEVIRNENSPGSHRVVSTYAKNEGSNPGYRSSDHSATGETKANTNHSNIKEQGNQKVKTHSDQKQRPHEETNEKSQTETHKPQGHSTIAQPQRNGEPVKLGKELINSKPLYQEAIVDRDTFFEEKSSEELEGNGFLGRNFRLDSKEYDTDFFETLSRLRQSGYLNLPDLLGRPINPQNTPRSNPATPDVTKMTKNFETGSEKSYNYETELTSPLNPPEKSKTPHPVTTYKPSKRHSFYQPENSNDMNSFGTENVSPSLSNNPSHSKQGEKGSKPTSSQSPLIVRELVLEDNSQAGLKQFEEELQDFSNLFHHEKSLAELAKSGPEVAVRGDDWLMSNEGSTAVILMGMCSLIMILICFLFVMKKFHRQIRGKGKKELVEEEEKAASHHKHHFGPDLHNLHIPASLIPHLPFLHSLTHHHHHNLAEKIESTAISPSTVDEELSDSQLGRLWFSVRYDDEKFDLRVNVMHAKYPKGREVTSNTGELWVEGTVLSPMNTVIATSKTTTRRATYSPVFNHCFLFLLEKNEVKSYILKLTLHDQHPKKGQETVGSIIFPFSSIDLSSTQIYSRDLL